MLMMLVLPAPDGPNSAVAPPSLVKRRVQPEIAEMFFDVDRQHVTLRAAGRWRGARTIPRRAAPQTK